MLIWAVCKDPGGTAGLLPVVTELRHRGHKVKLIANGKAVEILSRSDQNFVDGSGPGAAEFLVSPTGSTLPTIFVSTMCSHGGLGRDLVPLLREQAVPIVALQDYWVGGAGQANSWLKPEYRPDYLTTNDQVGKDLIAKIWPDFDPARIIITGFPAFDKYANLDLEQLRRETRWKLGIDQDGLVLCFAGGGPLTHLAHELLGQALRQVGINYYYIPRPHPRTTNDFPEEAAPWQHAVAAISQQKHTVVYDFFNQCDMTAVVAASDVVCSISSTALLDAAVMRKVAISILGPEAVKKRFRDQMVDLIDQYPLVPLGCCLEATTAEELKNQLDQYHRHNPLRAAQEKQIKVDGHNATRVADLLESIAS